jgi:hypothetical protein
MWEIIQYCDAYTHSYGMTQYTRSSEHTTIGAVLSVDRVTTHCLVTQQYSGPRLYNESLFVARALYILYIHLLTWLTCKYPLHCDKWLTTANNDCDKRHTRPLVREGAPQQQDRNCQTIINIWSWAPDGARHQDWLTDWPSVAMWLRLRARGIRIGWMRVRMRTSTKEYNGVREREWSVS